MFGGGGAAALEKLHTAVRENQLIDVKSLLASDSNLINMADDKGITALILAASKGHGEMVGVLLEFGADKTAVTKMGNNALQAARMGQVQAPGDARFDHAIRILEAPPGLKLEGGSLPGKAAKYGGTYKLDPRKLVNGRPAYQHTSDATLWIAFDGASTWIGQPEDALGQKKGSLVLKDSAAASPDVSSKTWQAGAGSAGAAWVDQPELKCTAWTPPPAAAEAKTVKMTFKEGDVVQASDDGPSASNIVEAWYGARLLATDTSHGQKYPISSRQSCDRAGTRASG